MIENVVGFKLYLLQIRTDNLKMLEMRLCRKIFNLFIHLKRILFAAAGLKKIVDIF